MSVSLQPAEIPKNFEEFNKLQNERQSDNTTDISDNSTSDGIRSIEKAILDPLEEDVPYTKTLTVRDSHETSPFKQAVKGFVINKLSKKVGSSHILSGLTEKIVKKLEDNKDNVLPGLIHTSESELNLRIKESSVEVISTSISCELKSVLSEIALPEVTSVKDATDCLEEFSSPTNIESVTIPSRASTLRSNSISLPSSPAHRFDKRASSVSGSLENMETVKNQLHSSHLSLLNEEQKFNDGKNTKPIKPNQIDEIELKEIQIETTDAATNIDFETSYLGNAYSGRDPDKPPSKISLFKRILSIFLLLKNFVTSVSMTHLFLLASIIIHNIEIIPFYVTFAFDGLVIGYVCYSYLCILMLRPIKNPTLNFPYMDANLENASILVSKTKNITKGSVKILKGEYDPEMVKNHPTELVEISIENYSLNILFPKKKSSKDPSPENESLSYDLLGATISIVPKGLSKKRIWNKKYPICIALPLSKNLKSPGPSSSNLSSISLEYLSTFTDEAEETSRKAIYLFTLTDREKESLFWVLQKNIQLIIDKTCSEILFESTAAKKDFSSVSYTSLLESNSEDSPLNRDDDDNWSILDKSQVNLEFDGYMRTLLDNFERMNKYSSRSRSFEDLKNLNEDLSKSHLSLMSKDDSFLSSLTGNHPVDWLNLVLGRVFYDFLTQKQWSEEVKARIQKKLDKIEMPTFIESLVVTDVYLGSSLPQMHNVSNPVTDTNGVWFNFDFNYYGSFQMTLTTKLKLAKGKPFPGSDTLDGDDSKSISIPSDESSDDEGNSTKVTVDKKRKFINRIEKWISHRHFQAVAHSKFVKKYVGDISNMPLTLTVELNTLHGILTVNIPPAPTDRIWYGFRKDPVLTLNAYPRVGTREINLSAVVQMIEKKLIQEFKKAVVMPNMDDLLIPIMFSPVYDL